ncbi:MAG: DHH family phosphoesterase [Tissierellia bacterium]|nr:DHH family phosphoesterase [Tissierellia bacterium]
MKKSKCFQWKDLQLYLGFILLLSLALLYENFFLGGVALVIFAYILYFAMRQLEIKNKEYTNHIEMMSEDFDQATKHAIFNMPFPLVITDENRNIIWYNTPFLNMFEDMTIMDLPLEKLVPSLKDVEGEEVYQVKLEDKHYLIFSNIVDTSKTESDVETMYMYYWVDNTEKMEVVNCFQKQRPVVCLVEVDNFDEAMDATPSDDRPRVQADLDSLISSYFYEYESLVRKFENDTYLVVITYEGFMKIREKRFGILDKVRNLNRGNTIPLSLSIGVSSPGLPFKDSYKEADTCLDVALGRGGDQAVVRVDDSYEFFGGKSKAVEKRNKVKARVLGIALRQLIDKSSEVFVMPHRNADMDAIGSGIGVLRAIANRNKKGYLILNNSNPSIDNLILRMEKEEPEMRKQLIKGEDAENLVTSGSLLILVDNHKPSFTEYPPIIDKINSIVIIDHHRRGKEFVENPVLTYVEPYASSTCELVTEMLTYMSGSLDLTNFEADAMMSGIVVDTKNFTFHTGVRTFEAASILRRAGADMSKVRELFEDDYDTILMRAEVVHNAKIIFDNIAISFLDRKASNSVLVAAQAADELLDIHGIKASFVLTKKEDVIHISGRSLGDISVQLILEKIGGGGHLNMAGAQLETESLEEAQEQLEEAIAQYLEEGAEV